MVDRDLADRLLVLRADASRTIGTGHLMRLLALGQAWRDRGGGVRLLVAGAPPTLLERFADERIGIERIPGPHPDPLDAERIVELLTADPTAVAAIDGPAFDAVFADALGGCARRVMVVDDLAEWPRYPVGLVLNQNAHADRASYPPASGTEYLLGLSYVLLRREFRAGDPERQIPPRARRLLVTFGGADPAGMVLRTLVALRSLPDQVGRDLEVRAIIGAANPTAAAIEAAAATCPVRVVVTRTASDMRAELGWADIAVVSGGTTVWELARMGCPAIVVETGPSEGALALGLARLGLFERLGPAAAVTNEGLAAAISSRALDSAWRAAMARLGPQLVDGRGTTRVVDALSHGQRESERPVDDLVRR